MKQPTPTQLQVLALIAEGYRDHQVADELHMAPSTVKTHVQKVLYRLQAKTRTHAVVICFRNGWLA